MTNAALPGISVVTLGVADMERSERFYMDGLGLEHARPPRGIVYFKLAGVLLALFPRDELARYAGVEPHPARRLRRHHALLQRRVTAGCRRARRPGRGGRGDGGQGAGDRELGRLLRLDRRSGRLSVGDRVESEVGRMTPQWDG